MNVLNRDVLGVILSIICDVKRRETYAPLPQATAVACALTRCLRHALPSQCVERAPPRLLHHGTLHAQVMHPHQILSVRAWVRAAAMACYGSEV